MDTQLKFYSHRLDPTLLHHQQLERTILKAVAFLFYHPIFALLLGFGDQKQKIMPGFPVTENYTCFSCNSLQILQPISNNFWQIFFFSSKSSLEQRSFNNLLMQCQAEYEDEKREKKTVHKQAKLQC